MTTLQLEESLAKKYAAGQRNKKERKTAAKAKAKAEGEIVKKTPAKKEQEEEEETDDDADQEDDDEEEEKEEEEDEEEEEEETEEEDIPAKKKPAGALSMKAVAPMKSVKAKPAIKKEKGVKKDTTPPPKKTTIPHFKNRAEARCPKKGEGPIDYKGGRIYTSTPRSAFRVIRLRGNFSTERQARWTKSTKPDDKAFKNALRMVDEYKP